MKYKNKNVNYLTITIVQIILVVTALLLDPLIEALQFQGSSKWFYSGFLLIEGAYLFVLRHLISFFIKRKYSQLFWLIWILTIFVLTFLALNPFWEIIEEKRAILFIVHAMLLTMELFVVVFCIKDMFTGDQSMANRLWSSVSVYMMLVMGWASFFDLIIYLDPMCFGVAFEPGFKSYTESLYFSLISFSGGVPIYEEFNRLIRNLSLIEGVWGDLYIVFLIGRLLGMSTESKEK